MALSQTLALRRVAVGFRGNSTVERELNEASWEAIGFDSILPVWILGMSWYSYGPKYQL